MDFLTLLPTDDSGDAWFSRQLTSTGAGPALLGPGYAARGCSQLRFARTPGEPAPSDLNGTELCRHALCS